MAAKPITTRIYSARDRKTNTIIALVDSISQAGARSHVAKSAFDIDLASQKDLIEATKAGIEVEAAGAPEPEQLALPIATGGGPSAADAIQGGSPNGV